MDDNSAIEVIDIIKLYEKIKTEILSWDKKIQCGMTSKYIKFSLNTIFLKIFPYEDKLTLSIELKKGNEIEDPKKIVKHGKSIIGTVERDREYYTAYLSPDGDIYYILTLIQQAYENQ